MMMNEPANGSQKKPDASWFPVIMSITVYPGIGQWLQKRRTAGSIYLAFFTVIAALFTWTMFVYMRELIPLLREALSGTLIEPATIPPLSNILKPFAVVLFIYLGNVVDVLRGRMQLIREQPELN